MLTSSLLSPFFQERDAFVARVVKEKHPLETSDKRSLSADEMSEFYKAFLDKKLSEHATYNKQWQARNFKLVALSLAVAVEKAFKW